MSGPEKAKVKPNSYPRPGPIGNTQGLILPATDVAPPGGNTNPPVAPETEREKGWWQRWGSAVTHTVLDVAGLVPVLGEAADGANALVYLAEGDKVNAALSAAAMVPGLGMAATGTKLGKKVAGAVAEGTAKTAGRQAPDVLKQGENAAETTETARKASGGGDGGHIKGKKPRTGETGKCGEWLARQDMMQEGFDQVVEVQNNSGQGVDLIGRNSKTGEVKVWEVKTTEGTSAPSLSGPQSSMGGPDYTADRLGKASTGYKNYGKVPEAMENAEKALGWIDRAERAGKLPTYEKREVFIDDITKGCTKHPGRPSKSKPWPAK